MDITYLFFLPAILILGVVTSYTDIKFGKIKNRHILIALAYIPIAYAVIVAYYFISAVPVSISYFSDLALNMAIALVFSFAAWHFKVWSAADGKLFFAYSGFVPLMAYSNTYFAYFPSFVLLINTFFPIFLYYAVKSIFFSSLKEKTEFFRKIKISLIAVLILNAFWISWVSRLIAIFLKYDIGLLGNIMIIISIIFLVKRSTIFWKFSLGLSALRIVFDYSYVFTLEFLWQFIILSTISISIFLVLMLSSSLFTKTISIKNLKPGLILSDYIYYEKGKYKKIDELEAFDLFERGIIKKNDFLKISKTGEGLTREDIESIKKLRKTKKLDFSKIMISQTLPFSPFLFFGVLLTLVASGNFIILLGLL